VASNVYLKTVLVGLALESGHFNACLFDLIQISNSI